MLKAIAVANGIAGGRLRNLIMLKVSTLPRRLHWIDQPYK
jgi:hypothetical protein